MSVKIIQWNACSINNKFDELKLLIDDIKPIIICLQETLLNPIKKIPIKNFKKYRYDFSNNNGNICGGVSTLVHNSVHSEIFPIDSNLQVIGVKIKTPLLPYSLTICNIYCPPAQNYTTKDMLNIQKQLSKPYLIVGDFNAHGQLWGSNFLCPKGNEIENFLYDCYDLALLNNRKPTFLSHGHKTYSHIDLTFASRSIASKISWDTYDDLCQSDHFPIIITLENPSDSSLPQSVNDIWLYKRANWDMYKDKISFHKETDTENISSNNINDIMHNICNNIIAAANEAIPKYKRSKRPVVWFNNEIKAVIKQRKKALKRYHKFNDPDKFIEYKRYRALSRKLIKKGKKRSWETFVNSIDNPVNSNVMFQQMKRLQGKNIHKPITSILDNTQTIITNHSEMAEIIAEHFANNTSNTNTNSSFITYKTSLENTPLNYNDQKSSDSYNLPFTLSEMNKALLNTKSNAVGTDKVSYQMLKELPYEAHLFLLKIYNVIWQSNIYPSEWANTIVIPVHKKNKDPKLPDSYRPICLINCACKILEKMINYRLNFILEKKKTLESISKWRKMEQMHS